MLPLITSDSQGAFVDGCKILDNVLIAHECIDSRNRQRRLGLICELDFEKAYDMVDWVFLHYMLGRMGFGKKLRDWIHACVSFAQFFVLVNGSPKGFFKSSIGIRQGDLLSPMFVIVVEACML